MLNKIEKATSSMMESGLYAFYMSLNSFKQQCMERIHLDETNDEFRALTAEQLKRPLLLVFALWTFALIIFISEHIILKWYNWRDRNHWINLRSCNDTNYMLCFNERTTLRRHIYTIYSVTYSGTYCCTRYLISLFLKQILNIFKFTNPIWTIFVRFMMSHISGWLRWFSLKINQTDELSQKTDKIG